MYTLLYIMYMLQNVVESETVYIIIVFCERTFWTIIIVQKVFRTGFPQIGLKSAKYLLNRPKFTANHFLV